MKRFQFKFETILKHRKRREDDCLRALGAAQRTLQAERERKSGLECDLADALLRREGLGSSEPIGIDAFLLENSFIEGTKQRIIQADQAILRANRSVEKAMRVYLMARRQAMVMETLKDKAREEYRRERNKWEQRQQDDLTIMRNRFRDGRDADDAGTEVAG